LLGAGNANDVDLARLTLDFHKIGLVDLDAEALAGAVERLSQPYRSRVEPHGNTDLTGIISTLASWQVDQPPSDAAVSCAIQTAQNAPAPDIGMFDLVVSTCVLSQLVDSIYMRLAQPHPRCLELVMAVRNRHLEMLIELLKPGGVGILVTDFVSTETAPEIAAMEALVPTEATRRWLEQRNFFTGANPFAIRDYYQNRRPADSTIGDVQLVAPWRWDIGAKQFAVAAVTFRRAS
jgi:hypothetical protein